MAVKYTYQKYLIDQQYEAERARAQGILHRSSHKKPSLSALPPAAAGDG